MNEKQQLCLHKYQPSLFTVLIINWCSKANEARLLPSSSLTRHFILLKYCHISKSLLVSGERICRPWTDWPGYLWVHWVFLFALYWGWQKFQVKDKEVDGDSAASEPIRFHCGTGFELRIVITHKKIRKENEKCGGRLLSKKGLGRYFASPLPL